MSKIPDFIRNPVVALLAFVCVGCGSVGMVTSNAPPPQSDHAYFVLGVEPPEAKVSVATGTVENGVFTQTSFKLPVIQAHPVDGFIVGETTGDSTLAITMVTLTFSEMTAFGPSFRPCSGTRTLVFKAPAGKVLYIGNVRYDGDDVSGAYPRLMPHYSNDLHTAQAFMAKDYPQLASKLEPGSYELLASETSCY